MPFASEPALFSASHRLLRHGLEHDTTLAAGVHLKSLTVNFSQERQLQQVFHPTDDNIRARVQDTISSLEELELAWTPYRHGVSAHTLLIALSLSLLPPSMIDMCASVKPPSASVNE